MMPVTDAVDGRCTGLLLVCHGTLFYGKLLDRSAVQDGAFHAEREAAVESLGAAP